MTDNKPLKPWSGRQIGQSYDAMVKSGVDSLTILRILNREAQHIIDDLAAEKDRKSSR